MTTFSSQYQIIDTLHENLTTVVYRATHLSTKQSVIIKMLKQSVQDDHNIAQFVNEYQILSTLKSSKIIKMVNEVDIRSRYIHIFEDIGGDSLFNFLQEGCFGLDESLDIAIDVADTIRYLHQKHIIHADINPKNVIYNPKTKAVQIIDFGYSIYDDHYRFNNDVNVGTSGNLLYMSPEQTGRTKQKIDHRTDFYSFGMTLYHLFSGRLPFDAKDRYELIHKQIALDPVPLHGLKDTIPLVLSNIVEKLIEKQPDRRYQSDDAIVYDLKQCRQLFKRSGGIEEFVIATQDRPLFKFGERLFGREKEISLLRQAAEKALSGSSVKMLVSGSSGVGKTRLIEEFFTYINTGGFRIFKGKFEQYQTAAPYHIFKQIFSQFHLYLKNHTQGKKEFKIHPNSIQVLCQVFPELCEIFPLPSDQPCHSSEEISNQLPYALEDFFTHIVTAEAPLILFMDDLQWADSASVEVIQKSILEISNPNLHFIASYRDNEIDGIGKLIETIDNKSRFECYAFHLLPLNEQDINTILYEFLHEKSEQTQNFASLIYKKTNGNPFYIKTFLHHLIDSNGLRYENGKWNYSLEHLKSYSASINIVTIINAQFSLLDAAEQLYLQYLAILGNRNDLGLTLTIMDFLGQPNHLLEDLEEKGFIELLGREYQFVHDQIHQFVFSSIEKNVKKEIHKEIGHYLERISKEKNKANAVAITHHLNHGYDIGHFPSRLYKLNVQALDEMIKNNSYALAMEHVRWIDTHLFHERSWGNERALTFHYQLLKGKTLYLNALHNDAYTHTVLLMAKAKNINERLMCFTLLKNICVTKGSHFNELIEFGDNLLKELGLQIPNADNELHKIVEKLDRKIKNNPLYGTPDEIVKLPILQNQQKQKILSLLVDYWEAAFYLADIEWMQWAYLNIIDLSFRFGNSSESSFGYVLYGASMVSKGEYTQGYRFGIVSLKLNHELNDKSMLPKVHNFFANFINPYIKPLSSNVALYQKSLQQSKMNGDIIFGTWANFLMHFSDFLAGESLENLRQNIIREQTFILRSGDTKMIAVFQVLTNTVRYLQDPYAQDFAAEEKAIALWESEHFYPGLAWYGILKAQTCFIEGEWKKAYKFLEYFVHYSSNEVIMFPNIRLHYLRALLLLNKRIPLSDAETALLNGDLLACDSYSKAAPANYKFWKLLLKAERIKSDDNHWNVAKAYDETLKEARKSKNPFFIAMGNVCAGRYWKKLSYPEMSHSYFNEAVVGLNQWGAYEAAKRLKEKYIIPTVSVSNMMESSSNSSFMKSEPANFQSLLKSFQAISQVMNTDELVTTLLKIILENATASRAVLMFKDGEDFYKSAGIDFKNGEIEFFNKPLNETTFVPQHVLSHAINMKKNITLENPAESGMFQYDEYIRQHRPASCFVTIAMIEGSVQGALYIENRDVVTPLSPDTVQTLRLLLTQSAIIYKNASLYESLKINEKSLNKAQQIAHIGSWQYNRATDEIVWSAETYRIYDLEPFEMSIDDNWFMRHLHPEDEMIVLDAFEKAMSGQHYYDVTHRIVTAAGKIKFVHQRAEVFWEGEHQKMSGTIQDITELKHSEALISQLSQVVDQNPYTTIITDIDGSIEYVNKQCLNMTGYFQHELIGQNMNIFRSGVHSDSFYRELWNTISLEKEIWRSTMVNRMKNGEHRDCESTIFPIFDTHGEIVNFVTIQEDVTERNIKDKLFLMQTRQAQMGEMLSMIAHQWRQPLTIMSAYLGRERINIFLQKATMEDFVESIDAIELQIQYLSRTITDFRDFFKPDKQAVATTSATVFSKTLNLIEHSLIQNKIAVHQTHSNDHQYRIFENELVQVMLNLFKNAQDVFEERSTVSPELMIMTDQQEGEVIISVEDNAGGIDPILMDTIFLPYVSTKSHTGTGLGLYMCKTVVENHCHGTIKIENTQKGAKFIIRIPIQECK
ncbi:protein kinase domain-containing protein [Sulfuricurvum sp.]|uniref:protein kinase domain-containing protein n=1 Tax=Sulfuricurvum sp. TaxID=2025608 RepID=UPI003C598590